MTIGQLIRKRRLELGLSQEELAIRLGNKSRASVSTVENDKEDLTTDRIRKYAEALQTTPAYLMGWTADSFDVDSLGKIEVLAHADNIGLQAKRVTPYKKLNDERLQKALALYDQYEKSIPEIKAAVDGLLKSAQPKQ